MKLAHAASAVQSAPSLFRLSLLSLLILGNLVSVPALYAAEETEFDTEALKSRGIDPRIAETFKNAPRFTTGETTVSLTVNGRARGKVTASFEQQGQLCADAPFFKAAGLKLPGASAQCYDLKALWPQTELTLNPGDESITLTVPADAIVSDDEQQNWSHGGVAGLLNYDAQYLSASGSSSGKLNYYQVLSEAGFNAGDWIFRSRQTLTHFNNSDTLQHQNAYAQRTLKDYKKIFQAGQISLGNSMFGTGQVLGFQLFPDQALQGKGRGMGLVEGIADSQSVVEIRQSGVLIHTTTVPAGPFSLRDFTLLNSRSDLEVSVTGSGGEKRQFIVPAAAFLLNGNRIAPGWAFGAGRLDQQGSAESPLLATAAKGWQFSPGLLLNSGVLASAPYQAGAVGVDAQPFNDTVLAVQATAARDSKNGGQGASLNTSVGYNLTERINLSANASQQTSGFRELSDAVAQDPADQNRSSRQYGLGIGWSGTDLGAFNLAFSQAQTYGSGNVNYLRGGWSKSFGRAYLGASVERSSGGYNGGEDRFYLTLSVPFGDRSVSSWVNGAKNGNRAGLRYSERLSQDRNYSLSTEHDTGSNRTSTNGNFDMVTPVSQLSAGIGRDSDGYTTLSGRASGAAVVHNHGVTLSPYKVGDTFGIAKIGDEKGVRVETPAGPTWTDSRGFAVIPQITSYSKSAVQVDTRSLGKNVDINNAFYETAAARGSVSYIDFGVVRNRRVLITVKDAQGQPLLTGASVFAADNSFSAVVAEKSTVFINDALSGSTFTVEQSGKSDCRFTLTLPEKVSSPGLYEEATAVCR